jgi:hypothetical protein
MVVERLLGRFLPSGTRARRPIFQLIYASVLANATEDESERDLASIIAASLRNNPPLDITGMLYYDRESFGVVQVLEGPEPNVRQLYALIQRDRRHGGCKLLVERRVKRRTHEDFGMALARVAGDELRLAMRQRRTGRLPASYARGHAARSETMHLLRYQYSSTLVAPDLASARATIEAVLAASVKTNAALSIGGVLCFNPATFGVVQVLEGPAFAVLSTFRRIAADPRHTGVQLTSEEVLADKSACQFDAAWGMLQSETAQTSLLDLSARLRRQWTAHASAESIRASVEHLKAQPRRVAASIVEQAVGGGGAASHARPAGKPTAPRKV